MLSVYYVHTFWKVKENYFYAARIDSPDNLCDDHLDLLWCVQKPHFVVAPEDDADQPASVKVLPQRLGESPAHDANERTRAPPSEGQRRLTQALVSIEALSQ